MHSALRELRRTAENPRAWLALVVIGLAVGLTGPFQTFETMAFGPRLLYWLAITVGTGFVGLAVVEVMTRLLPNLYPPVRSVVIAAVAGLPILAVVEAVDLTFGRGPDHSIGEFLVHVLYCSGIALAVILILGWLFPGYAGNAEAPPAPPAGPPVMPASAPPLPDRADAMAAAEAPFLRRLPQSLGRDLVRLSTQDHYVEAATPLGRTLILMRMSDALDELGGIEGLRIHRSHWISRFGAAGLAREDGRLFVLTSDGERLPVSRSYLPDVRRTEWLKELA